MKSLRAIVNGDLSHTHAAMLICTGILIGFLGMLCQQSFGIGLGVFVFPIGWVIGRHITARLLRRRMRWVAQIHALPWAEPEILDGWLVWAQRTCVGGHTVSLSRYVSSGSLTFCSDQELALVLAEVLKPTTLESSKDSNDGT